MNRAFSRRAGRPRCSPSFATIEPLESRQMLSVEALTDTTTTLIGPTHLVFTNPAPLKLKAKVEASAGSPIPTGSVAFFDPDVEAYALPYIDTGYYYGRIYGKRITLYDRLATAYPNDVFTGVADVADGTSMLLLGVARLNAKGVAAVSLPGLSNGAHSIRAVYLGDQPIADSIAGDGTINLVNNGQSQVYHPSTSPVQTCHVTARTALVVDAVGSQTLTNPSSIRAVVAWPNKSPIGETPWVSERGTYKSATAGLVISYNPGGGYSGVIISGGGWNWYDPPDPPAMTGVPSGSVKFYEGKKLLDTESADSAVFTPAPNSLKLGWHHIRIVYSGDGGYLPSTAFCNIRITHTPTYVSLDSSLTNASGQGLLTLNTTVTTSVPDTVTPSGDVSILIDDNEITVVRLGSSKTLTLNLDPGQHTVTAVYVGDKNCLASRGSKVITIPGLTSQSSAWHSNYH